MTIADKARDAAMHCEAKKHAYRQTQDGVVVSFVLHPHEVPDGLATAPLGSRYVLALVQINDSELPVQPEEVSAAPPRQESPHAPHPDGAGKHIYWREVQPAAQAGIRCGEPTFATFLRERRWEDWNEACADPAECVRLICAIKSRSELSTNHRARVIWHLLDSEYQGWLALERIS